MSIVALAIALLAPPAQGERPAWNWNADRSLCAGVVRPIGQPRPAWLPADIGGAREALWARRTSLEAMCLYEASALWFDQNPERAARLQALARFRARYDVLRCREPERAQAYPSISQAHEMSFNFRLSQRPLAQPSAFQQILTETAADPATYRYQASLESVCRDAGGVKSRGKWREAEQKLKRQ